MWVLDVGSGSTEPLLQDSAHGTGRQNKEKQEEQGPNLQPNLASDFPHDQRLCLK